LFGQWTGKRASGNHDCIDIDRASLGVNLSDPPFADLETQRPSGHQPAIGTLTLSKDRVGQGLAKREGIKTMPLVRQMKQVGDRWR
jgi:hypothetical protein